MFTFYFQVISIFVSKYKLKFDHELKRIEKDYEKKSLDSFENIRLIKYYKAEQFESNRLFRVLENYQVRARSTL
jgi:ABC-type transport system involved in Fe-S cluster assembly fused permease/ATPase subunit